MTDVIFRAARRADVPAVVALLASDMLGAPREVVSESVDEAYWRAFDAIDADPRNTLVVAQAPDASVVGCLRLTFIPSLTHRGGERAQIEGVRVAPAWRGRGLGGRMISWAVAEASDRGCRLVQLTTDKRRTDAYRFYEALGFEATHEGMKLRLTGSPQDGG
jgi:ribosomal protein S18 acetylase RimI-like enzyme